MAQLKSTVVQGTLSVTDNITENGVALPNKYLGISDKAASSASADAVPWSGVTNKAVATTSTSGIVSTTAQTFAGVKSFNDGINVGNAKLTYSTSGSDKILTVSFV